MTSSLKKGWVVKPLIDVATLQRGYDLPVQNRNLGNVPIFAANGPVGNHNEAKVPGPGVITGRSGSIGKVHYVDSDYWPLNTALYVKNFHGNDPKFIYYLLSTFGLEKYSEGTGVPTLNRNNVHGVNVSLPPLPEQKRIAAILDKADSIRRKRQETVRLTEEMLSSAFLDMFGDPETNPKVVKVVQLSEIATRITDGVHQKPNYTSTGVPFISVKDITTGTLKFDNCKFVSLEDHQMFTKRCKAEQFDILYTKVGATYGRPAIVDIDREFSLYVSVCLIKPDRKQVDSNYLKAVLGTKAIKRQADKRIKGIGVPDLHLDQIQQLLIPLPAMEEQREFARRVATIEKLKTSHNEALSELDTLFNSLLQRAFKEDL